LQQKNDQQTRKRRKMSSEQRFNLRDALQSDAKEVAKLADSIDLANVEDPASKGFLAANYTENDYSNFIKIANFAFILEVGDELVGFLVAYGSELVDPKDEFNMHVKRTICDRFVTVRQIFLSPKDEFRRKHFGSHLYKHLYQRVMEHYSEEETPRPIVGDIVMTPVNVPSRDFHLNTGFKVVGEMTTSKDNRRRYIFCNGDISAAKKVLEERIGL
jgi:predicted GNAT superfamily acetyltransferase